MPKGQNQKSPYKYYIKYSAIAFEMIAVILAFTYLGIWLDKKTDRSFPAFTLIGILLGVTISLYRVFKSLK